jgi:hypothetical protein
MTDISELNKICENNDISKLQYIYDKKIISPHNQQNLFILCCSHGHIEIAKWLYSIGNININIYDEYSFRLACSHGHFELAKWLYNLGHINIHANYNDAFKMSSQHGFLDIASWLYNIEPYNYNETNINIQNHIINDLTDTFRLVCQNGNIKSAQWLYSLGNVDIHANDEYVFKWCCIDGFIDIAQWLYSLGDINIDKNELVKFCCYKNNMTIAKWLYGLGNVNIRMNDDELFKWCCSTDKIEVATWLVSICSDYSMIIDKEKNTIVSHKIISQIDNILELLKNNKSTDIIRLFKYIENINHVNLADDDKCNICLDELKNNKFCIKFICNHILHLECACYIKNINKCVYHCKLYNDNFIDNILLINYSYF